MHGYCTHANHVIAPGTCDCAENVLDECGICHGDDSSCAGCDGLPNSGTVPDLCGTCGGSGIPADKCDCAGNTLDECGVCGGTNVIDECGVCGGPGVAPGTCDCAGNVLDACGVCGAGADKLSG